MSVKNEDLFRATTLGVCCDCHKEDTLDAMIKKDTQIKGLYHCKDCEVKQINKLYVWDLSYIGNEPIVTKSNTMKHKILKFLFEGI